MIDSPEALPERPYTQQELRGYLASLHRKCHATPVALTDVQARQPVGHPWSAGQPISFLELQLYNMRHVQEHAAQLSLFLGQHPTPDADLGWVLRTEEWIWQSTSVRGGLPAQRRDSTAAKRSWLASSQRQ